MKITRVQIENFRSLRNLNLVLGETTVLIGPNNAGKTAVLDAVRIVLTRRWGQRGTGFTEHDVHRLDPDADPRTLPPVRIVLAMEEPNAGTWDPDMVAALEDIMIVLPDGRSALTVQVTCAWNEEKEAFDPAWQFLDALGHPLPERRRAINLTGFFNYMPLHWLGALRDAPSEFTPRSRHWGNLLRGVRIPEALEEEALNTLADLDAKIIAADPRLTEIADQIGEATQVAIGEGPGAARLNTLPVGIEDLLQRTGIVLRNEALRPWLPLDHHGQGLQSLAVIFLFQAAVLQQLAEEESPGAEPVFAIEEPEAHLHPQAARVLWSRVRNLPGQKLMTTHSPYFLQHVPLRDIRLVRLRNGCSEVKYLPRAIASDLPWNDALDAFITRPGGSVFFQDLKTGRVAARSWFNSTIAGRLLRCYRGDPKLTMRKDAVRQLRHGTRILPSDSDERDLGFHGRRVRGEIFFARRWILVEGVTEYLLLHALGEAFGWPLDTHGVSVIDFQQSGNAGIYPALADGFEIPWHMIVDGDPEAEKFRKQILDRGYNDDDLTGHFETLTPPNDLEAQLIADGHEALLREVLAETGGNSALTCPIDELRSRLRNGKTGYMGSLSLRVAADADLAARMPAPFVNLVTTLQGGNA